MQDNLEKKETPFKDSRGAIGTVWNLSTRALTSGASGVACMLSHSRKGTKTLTNQRPQQFLLYAHFELSNKSTSVKCLADPNTSTLLLTTTTTNSSNCEMNRQAGQLHECTGT